MRFTSTILAGVAALVASAPAPTLVGLVRNSADFTNCSLLHIDPATGANTTIALVDACKQVSQTYPAFSTFDAAGQNLVVAISTAPAVYAYNVLTGALSYSWPLPTYNSSDPMIGFVSMNVSKPTVHYAAYIVFQSGVYSIDETGLNLVVSYNFPGSASVIVIPGQDVIAVVDETSAKIYLVDVGANSVSSLTTNVNGPWDAQYSTAYGFIVLLGDYQLYTTNPTTGTTKKVMNIPDGPGYPRVNGVNQAGDTFFFFDFASVYTIDLQTFAILSKAPFTAAPRVVGFPIFYNF
jgi:hypothetical protein